MFLGLLLVVACVAFVLWNNRKFREMIGMPKAPRPEDVSGE